MTLAMSHNTPGHSIGTLELADEPFIVRKCNIWGYLRRRGDDWYCCWCISVECDEKNRTIIDDGESYTSKLKPTMHANSLRLSINSWHDLDGVRISTGPDVDFDFLDPNDLRPTYSLYVHEHNKCSNNEISISERNGNKFRVNWTGTAYTLGTNYPNDDSFALEATATFTGISLSSEVRDEREIDSTTITEIFATVFSPDDFIQKPIRIRKCREDGVLHVSFEAEFVPK